MHYNPANDPEVINGVQEAYGLKVGDTVEYTNPNGVTFAPRKIVGFVPVSSPDYLSDRTVYINSDSPWFPVRPDRLKKIPAKQANHERSRKNMPNKAINNRLEKPLPDGTKLVAEIWEEPEYPGIRISLEKPDGTDEVICFAEFNIVKPEGRQLCVCTYASNIDEPVYYESYNDPGSPSHNT